MARVDDVAAAIIADLGGVDPLKLQKLLYYSQGWSLAWRGAPLFEDDIEAWRWGPAVRSVYREYREYIDQPIEHPIRGNPDALSTDEHEIVAAVVKRYGQLSGIALMDLTHSDPAWAKAWGNRDWEDKGSEVIPVPEIIAAFRRAPFGHPEQRPEVELDPAVVQAVKRREPGALRNLLESAFGSSS